MHVLPSPDSQDTVRESDCLQKRRSDRSPELLSSNAAMIVLSIYKNNPKKGWGTIRNMAFEDPIPCEDLLDAILKMNCIYDRMDFCGVLLYAVRVFCHQTSGADGRKD